MLSFNELLDRYLDDKLTKDETLRFLDLLHESANQALLEASFSSRLEITDPVTDEADLEASVRKLSELLHKNKERKPRIIRIGWWAAAACLLIAVVAAWLITGHKKQNAQLAVTHEKKDIAPGKTGAILHLADGRTINLDTTAANVIVANGFHKTGDSLVVTGETIANATVEAPLKRTIALQLPDKSMVWLNAGSSITFPTSFTGAQRRCSITGEAYFEVKHDPQKPFIVEAAGQTIEDIGTSFNVNAYSNESATATTLVDGAVRINGTAVLKPGQQFSNDHINKVNTDQVIAWKNGLFSFEHADLKTLMRQVSRWYGVEVVYEGNVPMDETFTGEMGRDLTLTQLLNGLQQMHFRFKIEDDKRIVILP